METRTLTGPVQPDEDAAKASLNGVIESLGKDGDFEIISLEAVEVDGGWVATLIVRILDPEPDASEDDDSGRGESERAQREELSARGSDEFVLLHGHLGKNELMEESPARAIPNFEAEMPGLIEAPDAPLLYPDEDRDSVNGAPAPDVEEPVDEIAETARESVESLSQEFQEAETGENVPNENGALDYALAATQSQRFDELQRNGALSNEEVLAQLEEEERERIAAEFAATRVAQGPAPDPAQSA